MKINNIDFPDKLLNALRDKKLVVFAGAGVSMGEPANLPDFKGLTRKISKGTGKVLRGKKPVDEFLGDLERNGVQVHQVAMEILKNEIRKKKSQPTELHKNLLRLYKEAGNVRLVTTNFDLLFEQAAPNVFDGKTPEIFFAPSLPLGRNFKGIVHVHGTWERDHKEMVLTKKDIGKAYLFEGWASRFIFDLFRSSTILFVGYSHNDPIMNYLAEALSDDSSYGNRFALINEGFDRWEELKIKKIEYPTSSEGGYEILSDSIKRLADIANYSLLDWRQEIISIAQGSPSSIEEEESSILEYALHDESEEGKAGCPKTHFFTNAATDPQWITWLDKCNYLDGLFKNGDLSEQEEAFARWLAEKFSCHHADDVFLLIADHENSINLKFWDELCQAIGRNTSIKKELLPRWVLLLMRTMPMPQHIDESLKDAILKLGQRCFELKSNESLPCIFDAMIMSYLSIAGNLRPHDKGKSKNDAEANLIDELRAFKKLWQK